MGPSATGPLKPILVGLARPVQSRLSLAGDGVHLIISVVVFSVLSCLIVVSSHFWVINN